MREQLECFEGRGSLRIERLQRVESLLLRGSRRAVPAEQAELPTADRLRTRFARESRATALVELSTFEIREDFSRTDDYVAGQSGQARHLDAVRTTRAAGLQLPEEDDVLPPLLRTKVRVGNTLLRLREVRQLVVVGRKQGPRTGRQWALAWMTS